MSYLFMIWCCLCWASRSVATATASATASATTPTNILILLTDDQDVLLGSFDTASYMPEVYKRLQQKGITFEKGGLVHVPICCPSRSSLLTGKYLHHGNLAKNNSFEGDCYSQDWKHHEEDHHTLAVHAQASGYTTLYAGKYLNRYHHHNNNNNNNGKEDDHTNTKTKTNDDDDSIPKGWDYWYGLEGNSIYYNYTLVEKSPKTNNTVRLHQHGDSYPKDYLPLVLEEYTLSLLPTLPEPWLAIVAWPTPHGPFEPEPKYAQKYSTTEFPKLKDFNATKSSQLAKHWLLRQLGVISGKTASKMEEIYRNRLRALKTVDDHVGKLVDWLETAYTTTSDSDVATSIEKGTITNTKAAAALPQRSRSLGGSSSPQAMIDRTLIIYTSDNGFQFGQHRLAIDKVGTATQRIHVVQRQCGKKRHTVFPVFFFPETYMCFDFMSLIVFSLSTFFFLCVPMSLFG